MSESGAKILAVIGRTGSEGHGGRREHAKLIRAALIPGSEGNILQVQGSIDAIKSKVDALVGASGY